MRSSFGSRPCIGILIKMNMLALTSISDSHMTIENSMSHYRFCEDTTCTGRDGNKRGTVQAHVSGH